VFVYLAPLLDRLAGAGPGVVGTFFALYGVMGLTGNTVASAVVSALGTQRTLAVFMGSTFLGLILWALGAGSIFVMGAGMMFWGFGFAAINSMQQARLAATAPALASVSIALNTSVLYVGQAVGSGIGGLLFAAGYLHAMGYAGVAFVASAWIPLALTWESKTKRVSAP
jgi:DHA1 family inner membrane transport protein